MADKDRAEFWKRQDALAREQACKRLTVEREASLERARLRWRRDPIRTTPCAICMREVPQSGQDPFRYVDGVPLCSESCFEDWKERQEKET